LPPALDASYIDLKGVRDWKLSLRRRLEPGTARASIWQSSPASMRRMQRTR
jgi:hypothetical protein